MSGKVRRLRPKTAMPDDAPESLATLQQQLAAIAAERDEALEQQTATAEILRVISGSPADVQPTFDAIANSAAKLCAADFSAVARFEGGLLHLAATSNMSPAELEAAETIKLFPRPPRRDFVMGRAFLERRPVQSEDVLADPEIDQSIRGLAQSAIPYRTLLAVPVLRHGEPIGAINLARRRVEPFTERQIELVRTFADQAVIAIENARLIIETREALEQQTATAEVLQVINSSPGDLAPVFDAMIEKAMRLCGAAFGELRTYDGEAFRTAAARGVPAAYVEYRAHNPPAHGPGTGPARLLAGERLVHDVDLMDSDAYRNGEPNRRALVELGGVRTSLQVPLRKDGALLGSINIYRQEVRAFSDNEVGLLQNFAAQAVIAIENARLLGELRQRTDDLQESLEYQTATSDVLKVISRSTFDLQPVLDALVETAARLCSADLGLLSSREDDGYRVAATFSTSPDYEAFIRGRLLPAGRGSVAGRAGLEGQVVQVVDLASDPEFAVTETVTVGKLRTAIGVPLMREGVVVGVLSLGRGRVEPFTERQIELGRTFADQAVIAIENTRLITETREALEQQTATAEVLGIINSSPGHLAPVFDAMVERAMRLCEAAYGHVFTFDGKLFHLVAAHGEPRYVDWIRQSGPRPPSSSLTFGAIAQGERLVHIADISADEAYRTGNPRARTMVDEHGIHTLLTVALRREGTLLGTIVLYRQDARPFSDKQIALLESFAAQAVIAMENARLLNETSERTAELQESLEYQTAISDVLKVISRSTFDLSPVLEYVIETAIRLCRAHMGSIFRLEDGIYRWAVGYELDPAYREIEERTPIVPGAGTLVGRVALEGRAVEIADALSDPLYAAKDEAQLTRARTMLGVPLMREGVPVGVIAMARDRVEPFSAKEIALVTTFADQAVIAIENTRLITETREALEQQTATAEILQVINSSPGDLAPVFEAILEKAHSLCGAELGGLMTYDGEFFRLAAERNIPPAWAEWVRGPLRPRPQHPLSKFVRGEPLLQIADLAELAAQIPDEPMPRAGVELGGIRTLLYVPLRKDGTLLGVITAYRQEVRLFTDKQIALLENFAAQAVIAMENARLLGEIRAARDAAERALGELKTAQANLIQAEKMASLGQLTAGIAHEIKNPLNFVNNFANLSVELLDELKETAAPALEALDADQRAEVDEVVGMLTGNLEKIAEHGRRADGIVRSMLEHSRGASGDRREVDLNVLVEEALNLAYHGARAQDQNFNITLEREFSEGIAPVELVPQDVTRVFLNLIGNGFYAANKRRQAADDARFKPTLTVTTRELGDAVEIAVRDNGIGIGPELRDKLFQPFFTTKPTGEGTGLGLSISYDIVTQQHGGSITVDSRVGEFTEFTVRLPRERQ